MGYARNLLTRLRLRLWKNKRSRRLFVEAAKPLFVAADVDGYSLDRVAEQEGEPGEGAGVLAAPPVLVDDGIHLRVSIDRGPADPGPRCDSFDREQACSTRANRSSLVPPALWTRASRDAPRGRGVGFAFSPLRPRPGAARLPARGPRSAGRSGPTVSSSRGTIRSVSNCRARPSATLPVRAPPAGNRARGRPPRRADLRGPGQRKPAAGQRLEKAFEGSGEATVGVAVKEWEVDEVLGGHVAGEVSGRAGASGQSHRSASVGCASAWSRRCRCGTGPPTPARSCPYRRRRRLC
jgi:hypothetical protein